MSLLTRLKPSFWDHPRDAGLAYLNYRRMWIKNILATLPITILPLVILAGVSLFLLDRQEDMTRREAAELALREAGAGAVRVASYLKEKRTLLEFALDSRPPSQLAADPGAMDELFAHLAELPGGIMDLTLLDDDGRPLANAGAVQKPPLAREGEVWFKESIKTGEAVSPVRLGRRGHPHLWVAVSRRREGRNWILGATYSAERLWGLASQAAGPGAESFLVDRQGNVQTPTRTYGHLLKPVNLDLPPDTGGPDMWQVSTPQGEASVIRIPVADSPFQLLSVAYIETVQGGRPVSRRLVLIFLGVSVLVITGLVYLTTTRQMERLYQADLKRSAVMKEIVYTNKLASIGRLAAGVAHEINNPTAIINEKAGLIEDLLRYGPQPPDPERILSLSRDILRSVKRVGGITHRLLGFAKHLPVKIEALDVRAVVGDVLGFLGKEALHRDIVIDVNEAPVLPPIDSDKSLLEQVFLNLVNNALNVLPDGGRLEIGFGVDPDGGVAVGISDNGPGIPPELLSHIFEPFFTTRGEKGTGLGLSITYGIVHKLGGTIQVDSRVGYGTTFTVTLPPKCPMEVWKEPEVEIGQAALMARGGGDR